MIILIYLKIRGRLGNQFFQYETVKNFQMKFFPEEKISIDFSDLKKLGTKEEGFEDSLKYFNVEKYETVSKINANLFQRILIFLMRIPNPLLRKIGLKNKADIVSYNIEKKVQPFLNKFGVYYMIHGYYKFKPSKSKNKIFIGNFESPKYFDENKEYFQKVFTPKFKIEKSNKELYDKIINNDSICITIRRGDFVSNKEFSKVHYVCNNEYFYKGIKKISKKVKKPLLVVFSDDIDWVKNNMKFENDAIFESGNDSIWEKVRLMSACKHFVISNSTFSWWTQYLSTNKNKIVIAPKKWKNISYKKDSKDLDIYEDFWIRI